jgi:hypothetical protein
MDTITPAEWDEINIAQLEWQTSVWKEIFQLVDEIEQLLPN